MDYPSPNTPDISSILIGSGILGLVLSIVFALLAFVVSAFIMSLWIRLILVFMRGALDREYGRMRMGGSGVAPVTSRQPEAPPPAFSSGQGPRDW